MSPTLNDFFKQKTKIPRRTGTTLTAVPFRKPPCLHQGGGITCDVGDTKERGTFFFFLSPWLCLSRILGVVFYFHGSAPFSREGGEDCVPTSDPLFQTFWKGSEDNVRLSPQLSPMSSASMFSTKLTHGQNRRHTRHLNDTAAGLIVDRGHPLQDHGQSSHLVEP